MKIQSLSLHRYEIPLGNTQRRSSILINIIDKKENRGWGEVAPLPKWSKESLEDACKQLNEKCPKIMEINWTASNCLYELSGLDLLPSVLFGLESAMVSLLSPHLTEYTVPVSALLMGSPKEILEQANLRYHEGYTSAKLKVSHLTFDEATRIIHELKDKFRLRIDVNRAWQTADALNFFAQFPLNTFDYVEEPFQNPNDLGKMLHPLAVDESFPSDLSLQQLYKLPTLKAIIYKPTLQGGMSNCLPLLQWTKKKGVDLVLSSSFESDLGLASIASIAHRLSLTAPVGIGTYHYLEKQLCAAPLTFSHSFVHVPVQITPKVVQYKLI